MIYRHNDTGKEIRVLAMVGYGVHYQTLREGEVTGTGTMARYTLDTEYEMAGIDGGKTE